MASGLPNEKQELPSIQGGHSRQREEQMKSHEDTKRRAPGKRERGSVPEAWSMWLTRRE